MIRYISPKRKHNKANAIYLNLDFFISFQIHGDPKVLHQLQGKRLLWQSLRATGDWCPHKFPKPKNREEVLKFFKRIRPRFRYEHEWADLRKDFISRYYAPKPKEWDEVLPEKIVRWASRRLQALKGDEACVDNCRVARVGNTCQERRYRRQVKQGCCGFCDVFEICPHDGHAYRLGFNYGH